MIHGTRQEEPPSTRLEPSTPERVETTVSRIVRDTQLANRVKAIHNHECQICGHKIILNDGARYAEGHHIQPLGEPHKGPDSMENILCLCPNCHVVCDFGVIQLCMEKLTQHPGHIIRARFIDYHNKKIYRGC